MKYKIGSKNQSSKFIDIEIELDTNGKNEQLLFLPTWRPGRYELGNFAKNIKGFAVKSNQTEQLAFKKESTHCWKVSGICGNSIVVQYQYYTSVLDAGSSWVDDNQLYINPVNCLMYTQEHKELTATINMDVPENYEIATGLKKNSKNQLVASNFDELTDSPIICSANLQHNSYQVKGIEFHLWFQGECKPNWELLLKDFRAFTKVQVDTMGSCPFSEYHFLFQILPTKSYHGVEHLNSTVILLGPGYEIMESPTYDELLGVSSHELFHAWNVKSIRPKDMLPYDFSKENYTEMGYLTEGVTTYLGDVFLTQSKLFNKDRYFKEVHKLLDRHSFNYGRYNYSVCESSFDTWLDGYVKGIPSRKGSIYTEGALLALCIDLMIIENNQGAKNLGSVMKSLFENYAKKGLGITEEVLKQTIKDEGGQEIDAMFSNYYHQATDYFNLLNTSLEKVGINLTKEQHSNYLAGSLGCYTDNNGKVLLLAPESPADKAGININDQVIAVNGIKTSDNVNKWVNYFSGSIELSVKKEFEVKQYKLLASDQSYFEKYKLNEISNPSENQKRYLKAWLKFD